MSGTTPSDSDKPYRGRRISWEEFTRVTGRPKPDYGPKATNDNGPAAEDEDAA